MKALILALCILASGCALKPDAIITEKRVSIPAEIYKDCDELVKIQYQDWEHVLIVNAQNAEHYFNCRKAKKASDNLLKKFANEPDIK